MKKVILLSLFAFLTAGLISCSDDEEKTTLKWSNESGAGVQDIAWKDSNGSTDQTWGGATADQVTTGSKEINALTGSGECNDDSGAPAEITIAAAEGVVKASANAAEIAANSDARLRITQVKKK